MKWNCILFKSVPCAVASRNYKYIGENLTTEIKRHCWWERKMKKSYVNSKEEFITHSEKSSQSVKKNIKFPFLKSISPQHTSIGNGFNFQPNKQSALGVKGAFFTLSSIIYFGDRPLETTFASETYLTGLVPAELLNKVSTVDIYVVNDNKYKSNSIPFIIRNRDLRHAILDTSDKIIHNFFYKIRYLNKTRIINNTKLNLQEIKQKRIFLKSTPRFIIIDPTNKCNCRCTICYRNFIELKESDLSMDNFNKIKSFVKNAADINLMGTGEAFLNKDFLKMARVCKKYSACTFLNTNGMLVKNNLESIIYIDNLNFSFDGGTKETFEKIRVGAKFEKVIDNIKVVNSLKHKPVIRLDVRVSKQNFTELPEIVKIAKNLDIKEVNFMPVYPMNESMNQILLSKEDSSQFKLIKDEVINLGNNFGIKCIFGFSLDEISEETKSNEKHKRPHLHCTAPWRMIYIESTGKIRPCCILDKYMGNLNENTIEEIWNNHAYRSLRASMIELEELNDFCKKCTDVQRFL